MDKALPTKQKVLFPMCSASVLAPLARRDVFASPARVAFELRTQTVDTRAGNFGSVAGPGISVRLRGVSLLMQSCLASAATLTQQVLVAHFSSG